MIITKEDAISKGLSHYFTGKPCKNGHIALRFVSTRNCVECNKQRSLKCNTTEEAYSRRVELEKKRNQTEEYKAASALRWKRYYERHPKRVLAKTRKYQADKLKRTPKWADLDAIKQFYENCPEGYHVDHIYPLRGKTVSGLHVLSNLQYLPARQNQSKGNKYDPES